MHDGYVAVFLLNGWTETLTPINHPQCVMYSQEEMSIFPHRLALATYG